MAQATRRYKQASGVPRRREREIKGQSRETNQQVLAELLTALDVATKRETPFYADLYDKAAGKHWKKRAVLSRRNNDMIQTAAVYVPDRHVFEISTSNYHMYHEPLYSSENLCCCCCSRSVTCIPAPLV